MVTELRRKRTRDIVLHESQGMNGENFLGGRALTSVAFAASNAGITQMFAFTSVCTTVRRLPSEVRLRLR